MVVCCLLTVSCMTIPLLHLNSGCRRGTWFDSIFLGILYVVFPVKLVFSLGSKLVFGSCRVDSVRVVFVSGLIMLCEGFGYGMSN